jgi:hypothetical protein
MKEISLLGSQVPRTPALVRMYARDFQDERGQRLHFRLSHSTLLIRPRRRLTPGLPG